MPSTQIKTDPHTGKQYYLITNVAAKAADREIDLSAEKWELPYSIDDSDLTFDGKPLNLLYEENRWQAEHVDGARERSSSDSSSEKSHVISLLLLLLLSSAEKLTGIPEIISRTQSSKKVKTYMTQDQGRNRGSKIVTSDAAQPCRGVDLSKPDFEDGISGSWI